MPARQDFISWDGPLLEGVVGYLAHRFIHDGWWDMGGLTVVVRTGQARSRLLRLLATRASGVDAAHEPVRMIPPEVILPGNLPERLRQVEDPAPSTAQTLFAWIEAILGVDSGTRDLILKCCPATGDVAAWMAVAERLHRLHEEIAAANLTFADAAEQCRTLPGGFDDSARWEALAGVQRAYFDRLRAARLVDRQAGRRAALDAGACLPDSDFLLVSLVDLNDLTAAMLQASGADFTALIYAPESESAAFDEYGRLNPHAWADRTIEIAAEQLIIVDQPRDQAAAAAAALAALPPDCYSVDDVVIGFGTTQLLPAVRGELELAGVSVRSAAGKPADRSRPARLLTGIADYLDDPSVSRFSALIRHPDIEAKLCPEGADRADLLTALDTYRADCMPRLHHTEFPGAFQTARCASMREALEYAAAEFDALLLESRAAGPGMAACALAVSGLLKSVYGDLITAPRLPEERALAAAIDAIMVSLRDLHTANPAFGSPWSTAAVIRCLIVLVAGAEIPESPGRNAIDLVGWLEVQLSPAPVTVICGMNEGQIPESMSADAFLPDRLRRALGLLDNARRYARDAYFLSCLLHSKERLMLIMGRRDAEGNALMPSRLVFACDLPTVIERALAFGDDQGAAGTAVTLRDTPANDLLSVPRPSPSIPLPSSISVTAFRDYLACPYRFYLKHVLHLDGLEDSARELSYGSFGTLIHETLRRFHGSAGACSDDLDTVRTVLRSQLEAQAAHQFGPVQSSPLSQQIKHAGRRLWAFAPWQVEQVRAGWETIGYESSIAAAVGSAGLQVRGKIDRIDWNSGTGAVRLIDFKTGDTRKTPDKQHRCKLDGAMEWIDLQMPLYREMWSAVDGLPPDATASTKVESGYVCLHASVDAYAAKATHIWCPVDWTDDDHAAARSKAVEVIDKVLARAFWPPSMPASHGDALSGICLDLCSDRQRYIAANGAPA